jgi:Putative transposase
MAFTTKTVVYDLSFKTAAETLLTVAADPKHLGARLSLAAVLHTWGSALTHHLHVHVIVPGGGLSPDGARWIACKPGFFLPVRVLSRLFRRLFLERLAALNSAGRLALFGDLAPLADKRAFEAALAPLRRCAWVVYPKRPFAGPKAVLAYLARYTHRVAISNSRLVRLDDKGVTFKWKDYRIKGRDRLRTMTLDPAEFIRRFLLHALPRGFHPPLRPLRKRRSSPQHRARPTIARLARRTCKRPASKTLQYCGRNGSRCGCHNWERDADIPYTGLEGMLAPGAPFRDVVVDGSTLPEMGHSYRYRKPFHQAHRRDWGEARRHGCEAFIVFWRLKKAGPLAILLEDKASTCFYVGLREGIHGATNRRLRHHRRLQIGGSGWL